MSKLHELIAVEPDLKAEAIRILSEVTNLFTNGQVRLVGQIRKYRPIDEEGDKLPDEVTELSTTVNGELEAVEKGFSRWLDVTIQKELTNSTTTADVVVDGKVLLKGLSAPALLNLESRLAQLRAVYAAIPTNDPTERWEYNAQEAVYVSAPRENYRTKKIVRPLILVQATKEHPAQAQAVQEDVREGVWTTVKRSGMLSVVEKRNLLERLDTLAREVKSGRQRANDAEAVKVQVANEVFAFIHRE